jgi:hypothetical protein
MSRKSVTKTGRKTNTSPQDSSKHRHTISKMKTAPIAAVKPKAKPVSAAKRKTTPTVSAKRKAPSAAKAKAAAPVIGSYWMAWPIIAARSISVMKATLQV